MAALLPSRTTRQDTVRPEALTRQQVIAAIVRDSLAAGQRCSAARAERVVKLTERVRDNGGRTYVLNQADLDIRSGPHDVMAVIMPDVEDRTLSNPAAPRTR